MKNGTPCPCLFCRIERERDFSCRENRALGIEEEMEWLGEDKNVPTNTDIIDREAWEPCKVCKIQGLSEVWMLQRKKFCTYCGRPLTDEAWEELEKRLRG